MSPPFLDVRLAALVAALVAAPALARAEAPDLPAEGSVTVTLEEAVQLGLDRAFGLRSARLERDRARAQRDGAWAGVYPRLDGSIRYTRTVLANQPFAGTSAGNTFGAFGAVGWLQYNEQQRLAGQPPLTLAEYDQRVAGGLSAVGEDPDDGRNPFLVENALQFALTLSQVIYDDATFARLDAGELAEEAAAAGVDTAALGVVQEVSVAFYGALLAERQTEILTQSVARAEANVEDTGKRVRIGTVPEFQLVTAEVELANLQTNLARAEANAETAEDRLRLLIGLPETLDVEVRGALETPEGSLAATPAEAVGEALERRPELDQLEVAVEANTVSERVSRARYLPRVELFANLSYNGAIPDDRSTAVAAPNDPFTFEQQERGVFADDYWFPVFNFGLMLTWNLFEGFAANAEVALSEATTAQSRVALEEARLAVRLEVERALRELATTRRQIDTQERIRERAERNYREVEVRVREGVSTQFDLRQASEQLDESRFNHLQAVHDHLVARTNYLVAVGKPREAGAR